MMARSSILRKLLVAFLLVGVITPAQIDFAQANNIVEASCVIGSSSTCPAQSPQEIYNLYGTTTDGTYWLNVNGTATQTYLIMNRSYPNSGAWFLGMKGTKAGSSFIYSSTYWTSQTTTLNTSSLSNDVSTEAKFSAFNYLPVTQLTAVFRDRDSNAFNASGSGSWGANLFAGHTWAETVASQTMFSRFTTTTNLLDGSGTTPSNFELYRETNSSSGKLVFPYMTGYYRYGFNNTVGKSYRWGTAFNNENTLGNFGSADVGSGIGMDGNSAASVITFSDSYAYGPNGSTGANNPGTSNVPSGFQIWGKMATPSLAAPATLTRTNLGDGSVRLNIGAVGAATEYAVQYKTTAQQWDVATTVRVTSPNASTPSATLTGLVNGTYDFRVWSRATNNSSNTAVSLLNQGVDSSAPTVSSISITSTPGADSIYGAGETITATVGWSETVTVSGSPRIPIQGLSSKFFNYSSGSGSTSLTFNYVVTSGDVDRDGISLSANSLALNSGSIADAALNSASLTHVAISNSLLLQVDGSPPVAGTPQTSSNGSSISITYDETLSATTPQASAFTVMVNSVSNAVTSVSISDRTIQLSLTFSILGSSTVTLAYADPTAGNDASAIQDEAGNDAAAITTTSVTNLSTATSNTSAAISLNPASTTAIFRTVTTIRVTTNTAGRVDFYQSGKIIPNCRNIATSANVANCSWRPSVQYFTNLTARFRPTGSGFQVSQSEILRIYVTKRAGLR
jgi:uncharacterized repeat protein (TIGR02059 family)